MADRQTEYCSPRIEGGGALARASTTGRVPAWPIIARGDEVFVKVCLRTSRRSETELYQKDKLTADSTRSAVTSYIASKCSKYTSRVLTPSADRDRQKDYFFPYRGRGRSRRISPPSPFPTSVLPPLRPSRRTSTHPYTAPLHVV